MKKMEKYDVIVVGAGASGMMAAVSAARAGAKTAVLEHMEQAGRKLLSTGNGKCNFTNQVQGVEYYRGQNPAFVLPALKQFGVSETLEFFKELGVWPKEKRGGYYYPANEQAESVRTALLLELKRLKVAVYYNIGIRSIQQKQSFFYYETKQGTFHSRKCIIATGSKAAKKTGSDGSGIPYILKFGHKLTDFSPALVQLQGKRPFLKEIAGIRAESCLKLYINDKKVAEDKGELQLTEFGVSGIPAFQISRYAVLALQKKQQVFVMVDFLANIDIPELMEYCILQRNRNPDGYIKNLFIGLLNTRLLPVILEETGIFGELTLSACTDEIFQCFIHKCKEFRIDIIGSKSFDSAQVCAGGVNTLEIDSATMQSKLIEGLYFAGEVMDIDGMCGGYNLQWAWSSGWVAGHYGGML